jgi:hypothetical protein
MKKKRYNKKYNKEAMHWRYHHVEEYREKVKARSKKQYHANKYNPQYIKMKKKNFKDWIAHPENRAHFNELMRPIAKAYMRKKMAKNRKLKVCLCCGAKRAKGRARCAYCLMRIRRWQNKKRHDRIAHGLCILCGKKVDTKVQMCKKCNGKRLIFRSKYYKKNKDRIREQNKIYYRRTKWKNKQTDRRRGALP